ncbi:hypothetical protein N3K66_003836 [Trichothecium roseum]|uniref:Uncharacterized protein n=1 Tax=Trichothecium roseum TaxID=47278 RepID=A0ACC0V6N1_9HYPO|nr:hypothetical protein N3K66_003836 [Trichothecium roseum]
MEPPKLTGTELMGGKPTGSICLNLAVSEPEDRRIEFHIDFRDSAMCKQALQLLWTRGEAEMYEVPLSPNTAEMQSNIATARARQGAVELLEGTRAPPPQDLNYARIYQLVREGMPEGAKKHACYFWAEAVRADPDHSKDAEQDSQRGPAPPFSWPLLHDVISNGLADDRRALFPALSKKDAVQVHLTLGPKNRDGSRDVLRARNLRNDDLSGFVSLILNQESDSIFWIGESWEDIPTRYSPEYPVIMEWGGEMF